MANRDVALALAAAGYPVFPCRSAGPDRKRPESGIFWRGVSTTDEDKIEVFWDRFPSAIPGIDLAKVGLAVIDCDAAKTEGAVHGVPYFVDLCEQHNYPLDTCPIVVTPSGGWHVYFSQPAGQQLTNSRGALPSKDQCGLDVRGFGGFTIAPGSEFSDGGGAYVLIKGRLEDAPVAPDWLVAILTGRREELAPGPPVQIGLPSVPVVIPAASPDARLAAYAEAGVAAELARLAGAPKGDRNNTLNAAAFALGQMAGAGWIAAGAAQGWLEEAARTCGLVRDDGIRAVRATIRSGLSDGLAKPRQAPPDLPQGNGGDLDHGAAIAAVWVAAKSAVQGGTPSAPAAALASQLRALTEHEDGTITDAVTGEVVEELTPPAEPFLPVSSAAADLSIGGLGSALADFIYATAPRRSHEFAFLPAMALLSVMFGRRFLTPAGMPLNLYLVGISPSGFGKDHALRAVRSFPHEAGLEFLLGPSDFSSDSAVELVLRAKPCCIANIDEIGVFLQGVSHKNSGGHERKIRKALLELYSLGVSPWSGKATANKEKETSSVWYPTFSLIGFSTPTELFDGLDERNLKDGFLARPVFISLERRPPLTIPPGTLPPPSLIAMMKQAMVWAPPGNLSSVRNAGIRCPLTTVPFANKEAELSFTAFAAWQDSAIDVAPELDGIINRAAENGLRMATLRALSRMVVSSSVKANLGEAEVTADDVLWAAAIVRRSLYTLDVGVRAFMAGSDFERAHKVAFAAIAKAGESGLPESKLRVAKGVSKLDQRTYGQVIEYLTTATLIRSAYPPGKGRPGQRFWVLE